MTSTAFSTGSTTTVWSGAVGRSGWLSHPLFLGCVVVLAVNDHVLKARHPGWWSGKLSDIAGVAVVAVVAAVVVGPRKGLLGTAVGFSLLKTVPGAAELASPFLGGVTSRDPSDLLALIVLLPLSRLLRSGEAVSHPGGVAPSRKRSMLSRVASLAGLIAAVGIVSATSWPRTSRHRGHRNRWRAVRPRRPGLGRRPLGSQPRWWANMDPSHATIRAAGHAAETRPIRGPRVDRPD